MRPGHAWVLVIGALQAAALLTACSASPGFSYPIGDDDDDDDTAHDDDAAARPDAGGIDASSGVTDAALPEAALPDADASEPEADADANASFDAGPDATEPVDSGDADADADAGAGPIDPPLSALQLSGRWDRSLPESPRTAYPGARIVMKFRGSGITLRLRERKSFRSIEGTSQFSVQVDGQPAAKLITEVAVDLPEETRDYTLVEGLAPAQEHVVELVRRTEAEFGSTRLIDVLVADGEMLAPPPRPARAIEFVGDSNLTGYGIEKTRPMQDGDPPCLHTPENQNWEKSFPALLAARFGAEVEATAYSGKGVFYNQSRADAATLGALYALSIPSEPETVYDPSAFAANAVVILAGGNDYAYRVLGDYPEVADVQAAYDTLIGAIRVAHPTALLFATLSPGIDDWYPSYEPGHPLAGQSVMVRTKVKTAIENVVAARTLAGDTAIVFHEFPAAGNELLTACNFHPSPALHTAMASALGDSIATRLGW